MFDNLHLQSEETEILREKMNLKNKFVVMYHGTLTPARGLQESIEAINLLSREYSDITLFLVGDGIAKIKLEHMTINLNLGNRVIINDPVPHKKIPLYISLADVGILPFPHILWWRVSSPIKLMEYLAMGKPVIVTDIEAHRDVLNSNNCGIFIPSHNPEAIARGILKAYRKRNNLREIGQQGRKIIQEAYTWQKQASRLENFLRSIS